MKKIFILLLLLLTSVSSQEITDAWVGIHKFNGTYYDALGNTFSGKGLVNGDYYTVINYRLSDGTIIRQDMTFSDTYGSGRNYDPTPSVALSIGDKEIFKVGSNNDFQNSIPKDMPYIQNIPIGSTLSLAVSDRTNPSATTYGASQINLGINSWGVNGTKTNKNVTQMQNFTIKLTDTTNNNSLNIPLTTKGGGYGIYNDTIKLDFKEGIATINSANLGTNKTYDLKRVIPKRNKPLLKLPVLKMPIIILILSIISILYYYKYE
ncbi:hypothetical protein Mevan_0279 [Methanococcus vannielii SB]|uniref:Uncharacterized protein n=1 Tax=Methanococcus vannielii (strain ATCC 35089 / DSM 1224 / JCM 13029 / OCM 148 / SB) TaxID=406327 RepID=A6UNW6_METVS|nr:hypothetical protein [Methanococcus vannielii]ABR54188.1 hypothetical protein Mevan_0279 [Methanococcus vannielii SB]